MNTEEIAGGFYFLVTVSVCGLNAYYYFEIFKNIVDSIFSDPVHITHAAAYFGTLLFVNLLFLGFTVILDTTGQRRQARPA